MLLFIAYLLMYPIILACTKHITLFDTRMCSQYKRFKRTQLVHRSPNDQNNTGPRVSVLTLDLNKTS